MISYKVEANKDQIADAVSLFEFVGGNSSDAVRVAINRAAPRVRTKASSEIRTQVNLTAGYVRERLTITKASKAQLSGAIQTPSRGLLLSKFSTDKNASSEKVTWLKPPPMPPRGIKVKVKPSGGTKPMGDNYFYMVLPKSRALGIVRRLTKNEQNAAQAKGSGPGSQGGTIKVAYGPSLSQVFNSVRDDVLPEASEIYQTELLDAMRYLLSKQYPKE